LRYLSITLLLITILMGPAYQSDMQSAIEFNGFSVNYEFGERINFRVRVKAASSLQRVDLFIRPAGENTRVVRVEPIVEDIIRTSYDLIQHPLRPFSQVVYWYHVTLTDGSQFTSIESSFFYEDNRFEWKKLEENGFEAAWLEGGLDFGQSILNVTQTSWASVQMYLPADAPLPLRVFVYPNTADLQSALKMSNTPWIAGHASPDLGVVLVSIPTGPDQRAEMERQIPHELMHIVEYQLAGAAYSRLPVWLIEGLASIAELYPNQDYERVMQNAISENRLVPMVSLCNEFPHDLSGAILAYAQSASFLRFLHKSYGRSGLTLLISQYRDGYGCEEGVQAAFDDTLLELETRWKQEYLGLDTGAVMLKNLQPYIILLAVMIIPVIISMIPLHKRKETPQ